MRTLLATLAVAAFVASPVWAQTPDFNSVDTDGNGTVSWAEVQAAMPNVTQDQFKAADKDGSGELDQTEFQALTSM